MEGIEPWWEVAGGGEDERQSATARRSGSGGFLEEEDLRREAEPATPSCSNRELPGLKVVDINQSNSNLAATREVKTFSSLLQMSCQAPSFLISMVKSRCFCNLVPIIKNFPRFSIIFFFLHINPLSISVGPLRNKKYGPNNPRDYLTVPIRSSRSRFAQWPD